MSLISNHIGLKADHWHDTTQEQVDFLVVCQFIQGTLAHETIICMIEYYFAAHQIDDLIKSFCGKPFEESIGSSGTADTVDNVTALIVFLYELIDHINIILQVRIQ